MSYKTPKEIWLGSLANLFWLKKKTSERKCGIWA